MDDEERRAGAAPAETLQQKSERLKAARLQAETDRNARVARASRKATARRKILGDAKP